MYNHATFRNPKILQTTDRRRTKSVCFFGGRKKKENHRERFERKEEGG